MTVEDLMSLPEGAEVTLGHKVYRKTWSGAWVWGGHYVSSAELARYIEAAGGGGSE